MVYGNLLGFTQASKGSTDGKGRTKADIIATLKLQDFFFFFESGLHYIAQADLNLC